MRFMCFKGALNAGRFITFLSRLIKDAPNRIFLIVDNLRVHKSVKVSQWVEGGDEIELHFLPPYAPVPFNAKLGQVFDLIRPLFRLMAACI